MMFRLCCYIIVLTSASCLPSSSTDVRTNTDIVTLQSHISKLEQLVSNLQDQTQTQDKKYSAVFQSVLSTLAEKTAEISRLKQDHNKTMTELASVRADLRAAQKQLVEVKERERSCEANLTSLKADVMGLKYHIKGNISNLATNIKKLELTRQSAGAQLGNVLSGMTRLNSSFSKQEWNLKYVQSQVSSVQTSLKSCEDHLTSVQSEVQIMKTTRPNIADLMTNQYKINLLQPVSSKLASFQSSLKSSNDKLTTLSSDIHTLQQTVSDVSGLKTELRTIYRNLTSLQYDVNTVSSGQEDLKNRETRTHTDVQLIQARLTKLDDQCVVNVKSLETGSVNKSLTSVLFTARANHNLSSVKTNNVLKMDFVHYNVGNGYQEKRGVFKAPVTGYYLFWAGVDSIEKSSFTLSLVRESSRVVASGGSSGNSASFTYAIKVRKGEEMWIRADHHLHISGTWNSYFGGMLHLYCMCVCPLH